MSLHYESYLKQEVLHLCLNFQAPDLLPSVRFSLESAILSVLANSCGLSVNELIKIGTGSEVLQENEIRSFSSENGATIHQLTPTVPSTNVVLTAGLVDSFDSVEQTINEATSLVSQGFNTLKLKVTLN